MCNNNSINTNEKASPEILSDKKKNGKERPWQYKKQRNEITEEHYLELYKQTGMTYYLNKANKLKDCAQLLVFKKMADRLKLYQAWFCKVRLCPMCSWRRSLKIAYQNKQIVEKVNEREKVKWLFLTLTVRNVDAENLSETISAMFKGFNSMTRRKAFKTSVKGYFRALEITKNRDNESEWKGTYHPHIHVLLCVPSYYFSNKNYYIKQAEWTSLWQKAMKLDYKPIVHVQKVKPKNNLEELETYENDVKKAIEEQKAINEISKYPVKDTDIIQGDKVTSENVETVYTFDNALASRRLISYGGLLAEVKKELKLDDAEEGDLINISEEDEEANGAFEVMAKWHIGLKNYVIQK